MYLFQKHFVYLSTCLLVYKSVDIDSSRHNKILICIPPAGATYPRRKRLFPKNILRIFARLQIIAYYNRMYVQGARCVPKITVEERCSSRSEAKKNPRSAEWGFHFMFIRCLYWISQPMAEAPRTAALAPSRPLTRNWALFLKMFITLAL